MRESKISKKTMRHKTNKGLREIVLYLNNKYCPLSILMTGSRVYGNPRPDSDWDILVITEHKTDRIKKSWHGYNLDVTVIHKGYFKRNFAPDWVPPIAKSRIIKDTDKIGRKLIDFMKEELLKSSSKLKGE